MNHQSVQNKRQEEIGQKIIDGAYLLNQEEQILEGDDAPKYTFILQATVSQKLSGYTFTQEGVYQPAYPFNLKIVNSSTHLSSGSFDRERLSLLLLLDRELLSSKIRQIVTEKASFLVHEQAIRRMDTVSYHLYQLCVFERTGTEKMRATGHLLMLLASLEKYSLTESKDRENTLSIQSQKRLVQSLSTQVLANPEKLFHLESTSRILGVSISKLQRSVREQQGMSFAEYVRYIKLSMAHTWIRSGELSVSEAAYRIGYINLSHFSRIFKRRFSYLPKETGKK